MSDLDFKFQYIDNANPLAQKIRGEQAQILRQILYDTIPLIDKWTEGPEPTDVFDSINIYDFKTSFYINEQKLYIWIRLPPAIISLRELPEYIQGEISRAIADAIVSWKSEEKNATANHGRNSQAQRE